MRNERPSWFTNYVENVHQKSIKSTALCCPISLPSLNISGSLLNFESTQQLEILEIVLSVVCYSTIWLFLRWKHSGWRNKGITFEKKKRKQEQLILITTFHRQLHKSVFGDLQAVVFSYMKIFYHDYVFRKSV